MPLGIPIACIKFEQPHVIVTYAFLLVRTNINISKVNYAIYNHKLKEQIYISSETLQFLVQIYV